MGTGISPFLFQKEIFFSRFLEQETRQTVYEKSAAGEKTGLAGSARRSKKFHRIRFSLRYSDSRQ